MDQNKNEEKVVETMNTADNTAATEESAAATEVNTAAPEEPAAAPAKPEPVESMDDYAAELEASFRQINEGDIMKGVVIGVSETELTLDLGYYTDGIIRLEDASDDPTFSIKNVPLGTEIDATVIRRDDGRGHILMSMKAAAAVLSWDRLRELKQSQANVHVKISDVTRGGAVAYLEGIRGFIPVSKLALEYVEEEEIKKYLGASMEVRVITVDQENSRLVMSAKDILREEAEEAKKKVISNVEVGLVTEGVVESLKPYGAFVNIGNGISGLLHVSEISQKRIKHPKAVLKEGQKVKVKIISVKDGKLSLSMKALEDVMAEEVEEEVWEMPETESVTTSLGSLFAKIKL